MLDVLVAWWPVFLVMAFPPVATYIAGLVYKVVSSRLDHAIADVLPETAGEWLERRLTETGLAPHVRAIVADGGDRYFPQDKVIQLTPETHFKADPTYWATAAHELGHAQFYARHTVIATVFTVAMWLKWVLMRFGLALIFGNMLFGLPDVTALGFYAIGVAVGLELIVLIKEAHASTLAGNMLRGALAPEHFRAVRIVLFTAFGTYLAGFVSRVILLCFWDRVVELTGSGLHGGIAHAPTGWRLVVIAIVSIGGLAFAASRAFGSLSPRKSPDSERSLFALVGEMAWPPALVLLLLLSWNGRIDPTYAWCVMLAMVPAFAAIAVIVHLPTVLVLWVLALLTGRYTQGLGRIDRSQRFEDAIRRGAQKVADGTEVLKQLLVRRKQELTIPERVALVAEVLYLPLLFVFWMT